MDISTAAYRLLVSRGGWIEDIVLAQCMQIAERQGIAMEKFELTYEGSGSRNYLCMRTKEDISSYQLKMLEANEIPGLLKVHGTRLNGIHYLSYDITGMSLLKNALESRSIRGDEAKRLLSELLAALLSTEEYFLTYTNCLIRLDYLYLDEEQKPVMAYFPFAREGIASEEQVRQLYQELLAEYFGEENDLFFMELLRYVNKRDFSLAGLKKLLQTAETGKETGRMQFQKTERVPANDMEQPVPKQPAARELFFKQESGKQDAKKEEMLQGQKSAKAKKELLLDFAIPGMEQTTEGSVPKKKQAEPEKEKKSGLFGKLLSGKREEKEKEKGANLKTSTSEETAGQWRGTVMLSEDVEQKKTVMLGMDSGAYLYHNNQRIDPAQFPFSIGKQNADYVINKAVISRMHATLLKKQEQYYIRDENSSNHTYLNGKQLPPFTEYPLNSGDRIRLADEELVFCADGE